MADNKHYPHGFEDRINLADAVPLPAPLLIQCEPSSMCNLKCSYCPTGHPDLLKGTNRKPAIMDWDHCSYEGEEMIDYRVGAI